MEKTHQMYGPVSFLNCSKSGKAKRALKTAATSQKRCSVMLLRKMRPAQSCDGYISQVRMPQPSTAPQPGWP